MREKRSRIISSRRPHRHQRGQAFAALPAANLPGVQNNYQTTTLNTTSANTFDVRIDEHFNDRNQVFGRYSQISNTQVVPAPFGGVADGGSYGDGNQKVNVHGTAVSYTHVFTPRYQ